ncbi:MAG TPA: hypothetical protein VEX15_19685 [Nocardioidaceae bacterium]|nr:hypothetical protein [Nocardioidaceae bacterium]
MTSTTAWTRRTFLGALAATPVAGALPTGAWASTGAATSRDVTIGFVLDRGRVKRIDLPGNGDQAVLSRVTNRGRIVGKAPSRDGVGFDGLVGDVHRLRRFRFPGAKGTYATKANDRGQIVGAANRRSPMVGFPGTFGYLLDGGRFTRIAVPGAVYTQALGLNNRGQVVGEYLDDDGKYHGFRWERGRFSRFFDGPDGLSGSLADINDRGDMVGVYFAEDGTLGGFRLRRGRYTKFGAFGFPLTFATDINDRGQIAGYAISDLDLTEAHGFVLADGVGGPITQIDVLGVPRTAVYGLDDRGRLIGVCDNPRATRTTPGSTRVAQSPLLDALPLGLSARRDA